MDIIRSGKFGLAVPEARKSRFNYFTLEDGSPYSLYLMNFGSTPSNAEVYIEGNPLGSWRIPIDNGVKIEGLNGGKTVFAFSGRIAQRKIPLTFCGLISVYFCPGDAPSHTEPDPTSISAHVDRISRPRLKADEVVHITARLSRPGEKPIPLPLITSIFPDSPSWQYKDFD